MGKRKFFCKSLYDLGSYVFMLLNVPETFCIILCLIDLSSGIFFVYGDHGFWIVEATIGERPVICQASSFLLLSIQFGIESTLLALIDFPSEMIFVSEHYDIKTRNHENFFFFPFPLPLVWKLRIMLEGAQRNEESKISGLNSYNWLWYHGGWTIDEREKAAEHFYSLEDSFVSYHTFLIQFLILNHLESFSWMKSGSEKKNFWFFWFLYIFMSWRKIFWKSLFDPRGFYFHAF